ncbi:5042_t:CDS:2 [Ambispora gerdemannii]|uniref:Dolichyl-diphosphooligosaccharide--protein glycosyltransferase subunit OST2 n=1 Tax=Ambispora gerdemannii TaxID=144530 RepID=A0A9N9FZN4_9GLOM|nr:5042_t:CDS:2 [Ambispora gerdemannii]
MSSIKPVIDKLLKSYNKETPQNLKLIDAYLAFILVSGILQFVYVLLAGTYPYNAFLAGFISTVGQFVLAVNDKCVYESSIIQYKIAGLRIQANSKNAGEFKTISPERY